MLSASAVDSALNERIDARERSEGGLHASGHELLTDLRHPFERNVQVFESHLRTEELGRHVQESAFAVRPESDLPRIGFQVFDELPDGLVRRARIRHTLLFGAPAAR